MDKLQKYKPTDKMIDLIGDNYSLLQVMSRFGLSLGFGDKTVKEVCEMNNVDCQTFLVVVNFMAEGFSRMDGSADDISIPALVDYLRQAHIYFLDYCLPAIRRKLIEAIDCSQDDVSFLILKFFDGYMREVRKHMEYEEKTVFKYVDTLIHGNAPKNYQGEGTVESLLCARPGFHLDRTSTWGYSKLFYAPDSTAKAARLFTSVADQYKGNNNFEYDLVDIVRQSNADKGNVLLEEISQSYDRKDKEDFRKQTQQFLDLILAQDRLLSTRKEFSVSSWLNAARSLGTTEEEKRLYEWNASALITVWGDSIAANQGGLHDYSHREWSGLLKDLYYQRWKAFFEQKQAELDGKPAGQEINFYGMEKAWAEKRKTNDLFSNR